MKRLAAMTVLTLLAGVATAQDAPKLKKGDVTIKTDEFTGNTSVLSKGVRLDGVPFGSIQRVDLSYQKFVRKEGSTSYQVFAIYKGSSWMFIQEGASLQFLVDGQLIELSGQGSSHNRDVVSGGVSELAMYPVTPEQLRQIANGSEIKVRLRGGKGTIDATPKAANFDLLRGFIAAYIDEQ